MLHSIDFRSESPLLPAHIEVVPPAWRRTTFCCVGRGRPRPRHRAAKSSSERACAPSTRSDDGAEKLATAMAQNRGEHLEDLGRAGEALLRRQGQKECGLSIRARPQRRHSVEDRLGTNLEYRSPPGSLLAELTGVHADALSTVPSPAPGSNLTAELVADEADRGQLSTRQHTVLISCQRGDHSTPRDPCLAWPLQGQLRPKNRTQLRSVARTYGPDVGSGHPATVRLSCPLRVLRTASVDRVSCPVDTDGLRTSQDSMAIGRGSSEVSTGGGGP